MSLTERLFRRQWRPTLCLHLAPQALSGVLRRAGRPQAGSAFHLAIDNPDGQWHVALAALRTWLASATADERRMPLAISLASRWCALLVVPWSSALFNEASAQRFLHSQFSAVHGDAARGWRLASDDAPCGQPRIACGIEAPLLQGLQEAAAEHGRRLVSIEPLLGAARRSIAANKPPAFALVEAGRLLLATASGGRITAIHSQACSQDWGAELDRAWQRWRLRAPQLDAIEQVALIDVSGTAQTDLAERFLPVAVAGAAHLMQERAWA